MAVAAAPSNPITDPSWRTESDVPRSSELGADPAAPRPPRGLVVALIPAHNEEGQIEAAIQSLHAQHSPPGPRRGVRRQLHRPHGARGRGDRRRRLRDRRQRAQEGRRAEPGPRAPPARARATRTPSSSWTRTPCSPRPSSPRRARRLRRRRRRRRRGLHRPSGGGYVGMLQRNEYARYARDVARLKGKVLVLTGTATLFSVRTLRHVVWARAERLAARRQGPGLRHERPHRGQRAHARAPAPRLQGVSPKGCRLTTEVMESWRDLYRQRLRWKRGAIENLRDYGLTRVTARYWGRQLFTFLGIARDARLLALARPLARR